MKPFNYALAILVFGVLATVALLAYPPAQAAGNCPPGQILIPNGISPGTGTCIPSPYNVTYKVNNHSLTLLKVLWTVNGDRTESKSFADHQSMENSFPAGDNVVVQLETFVSDRAGTASGSGYVILLKGGEPATHGCYLKRSSGWDSMTIDVTGVEWNVSCSISGHTTSSDPHYGFATAPPQGTPKPIATCPPGTSRNGRGSCVH